MRKIYFLLLFILCLGTSSIQAQYHILHNFTGDTNGLIPHCDLIISGDTIFGTSGQGGTYDDGSVYYILTSGTGFTSLHSFNNADGRGGRAGLLLVGDVLYGDTKYGGADDDGVVFSMHTDGSVFRDLYEFTGTTGLLPWSELIQTGGILYGTTSLGGASHDGTIFRIDTNGTGFADMLQFNDTNGANPDCKLTLSGSILFGMTSKGGVYGYGNIFSIDTSGNGFRDLYDFNGISGANPHGNLLLRGGVFYGMTSLGGAGSGNIFSIDTDGSNFRNLFSFTDTSVDGANPWGSLIYTNGTLFGMTLYGGAFSKGVIFSIDTNGSSFNVLETFNTTNGADPWRALTLSNNVLYGVTKYGGSANNGVLFSDSLTLQVSAYIISPLLCNGNTTSAFAENTGSLAAAPYTYLWEPGGATTDTVNGLSAGTYTVTLIGFNGDSSSASVTITQPADLIVTTNVTSNITGCSGGANGSANASVSGGTPFKIISTVDGNHISGYSGDGGPGIAAEFNGPFDVEFDRTGNLFISDQLNNAIREVDTSGIIQTVVGNTTYGYSGDGGPATAAELRYPSATLIDNAGNLYIADENNMVVRIVNSSGTINTFAGNGIMGYSGDGGPATAAELNYSKALVMDVAGNLYIADQDNNVVRMVSTSGIISTIAGNGIAAYSGDGGAATAAALNSIRDITFDATGNLYISDFGNNVIRKVNTSGIISTVAGNYLYGAGYTGDGGPATNAQLNSPTGVATDISGNLYISDQDNNVIRIVNFSGIISTYSGDHTSGYSGDGGPATNAEMSTPRDICFDVSGNLYIAEAGNNVIRKVSSSYSYTYLWTPSGGTDSTASNLSAGTYTVTVTDGNGCTATASVTITQPRPLTDTATVKDNVTCNGDSDGLAKISVNGGTRPYTYSWSPNGSTTYIANNLSAGTYSVTVTDNSGCTITAEVTVTQPPILRDSVSVLNPLCFGETGSASIGVTGGTSPYRYSWIPNVSSTNTASGLTVRNYVVQVKDANGCWNNLTFNITQPPALYLTADTSKDNGSCNGTAYVMANGGVSPYTFRWNPGGLTSDSIKNQCAGDYCCTVTDANGCVDSICVNIPLATGIGNIESNTGQITVYPNPNNGLFTITFSNAELISESQPIVEIYNVLGQEIYSTFNLRHSLFNINLSDKADGIYLYRVITKNGVLLGEGKLIIAR